MVINLRRAVPRLMRADETGRVWQRSTHHRRDWRKGMAYRCFLNDQEVTKHTFYCDTRRGIVRMFVSNESGDHFRDPATGHAAWIEKRGRVRLRRKVAA